MNSSQAIRRFTIVVETRYCSGVRYYCSGDGEEVIIVVGGSGKVEVVSAGL